MITIEDIRNPKRQSGFDHVNSAKGGDGPGLEYKANRKPRWRASWRMTPTDNAARGPTRHTAEEAAQDYCDYVNGNPTPAALPSYPDIAIDMGNITTHAPKPEKITVIREKYVGAYDVYDVLVFTANGDIMCRKVGITARGHARYADYCKTFGTSIKPHKQAVTYANEAEARVAESKKVAEVCADPEWRRVGREAFAPVIEEDAYNNLREIRS